MSAYRFCRSDDIGLLVFTTPAALSSLSRVEPI
jgi:hypothetical protein